MKEPLQWLLAQSCAGLGNGALGYARASRSGKHEIQPLDEFVDRTVPVKRHAEHQPDHLFSSQAATPKRASPSGLQRFVYPNGIDAFLQRVECAFVDAANARDDLDATRVTASGDRSIM